MSKVYTGLFAALLIAVLSLWLLNVRLQATLAAAQYEAAAATSALERQQKALMAYQKSYTRDQADLAEIDKEIKELTAYANQMQDGGAECLGPTDTERLRQLWR